MRTLTPCSMDSPIVRLPKSGILGSLGSLSITSFSAGSASKAMEQVGSMISSSITTCTGKKISGQPIITGMREMPAMGTCTASM